MWLRVLVALFLWSISIGTRSDENHHTLWTVKGNHNTVYLLGSLHVLKAVDSELPPEVLGAYASAKALVMEISLNEISAKRLLGSILDLETLPAGQTLAGALGSDVYNKFTAHAKPLGLDPEFMSHFQPWFAAMLLGQLKLAKLGFDPDVGVDMQLAKRAQADHKDIIALETIEEQAALFAHLSLEEQRLYVLYSLAETDNTANGLDAIVSAWHRGDTKVLERLLSGASKEFPALYSKLTTDRNRRWLPTITSFLKDDYDYLVVVGALHLVGTDGIVELLQMQGYEVVQH